MNRHQRRATKKLGPICERLEREIARNTELMEAIEGHLVASGGVSETEMEQMKKVRAQLREVKKSQRRDREHRPAEYM